MRLVKINDVILNMDNITMIKSKDTVNNKVSVYAYTVNQEIWLGICDSREDYQRWVDALYGEFSEHFLGEVVSVDDDNEEELWE